MKSEAVHTAEAGVRAVKENAHRLGLTWGLRPGTVQERTGHDSLKVLYDGDTVAIDMVDLSGGQEIGARVMAINVPPSGNFVVGGRVGGGRQIAFAERLTSSTAASAAQGVLRIDNIRLIGGNGYEIYTSNLLLFSTIANDTGSARISATTDGSSAGTGSPLKAIWNSAAIATVASGTGGILRFRFTPSTNLVLSILLFTIRVSGTGNISIFASANQPTQLMVNDLGPAVRDTGVII